VNGRSSQSIGDIGVRRTNPKCWNKETGTGSYGLAFSGGWEGERKIYPDMLQWGVISVRAQATPNVTHPAKLLCSNYKINSRASKYL